jgi:hypothetical protein
VEATEGKEPKVNLIDYQSIRKQIDESLLNQILKENADSVVDRQIYSSQFFMLIKLLMQSIVNDHCMSEHRFPIEYKHAGYPTRMKQMSLQICQKVMFDFLAHFFENATMQPICDSMFSVMTFSDSYVNFPSTKEPSVILEFIQRTYLADNC